MKVSRHSTSQSEARFRGNGYRFRVVEDRGYFSIEATDIVSLRYSSINNVNGIMAEFVDDDIDNPKFEDSTWVVSQKNGKKLFKTAIDMLSSKRYVEYLERCLDEDRWWGEWEKRRMSCPEIG